MFKQRLLTLLVLVPIVLFLIDFADERLFRLMAVLLALGAAAEWLQLIPVTQWVARVTFMVGVLLMTWLCQHWFHGWMLGSMVVWFGILMAVVYFPGSQKYWGHAWFVAAWAWFLLPCFANSLSVIYVSAHGKGLLVYVLCLVWATDIGAYLAGKGFGRHKLIPAVSPGKTLEGMFGGLCLALSVAVFGNYYFSPLSSLAWFGISLVAILISMLGDLFISMLKRRVKIKDTGRLFPGHGGILDRVDSLIAAVPIFAWGLYAIPIGF